MVRKVLLFASLFGFGLLLGGCGESAEFKTFKVSLTRCAPQNIASPLDYTPLKSADIVRRLEPDTIINTYHFSNGTKSVCIERGNAVIIRSF